MRKNPNRIKQSKGDNVLDVIVIALSVLVLAITLYPLLYVVSMSISDPFAAVRGEVILFPVGFSTLSYKTVLSDPAVYRYYLNTILYTLAGIFGGIAMTLLVAYPLSRKTFGGRGIITTMVMITMFFSGGLIPMYIIVVKFLKLYNNPLAVIVPGLTTAWYIMVTRTSISSIPEDLIDSARIDGASELQIFGRIVVPLSKAIMAVLAVYFGVEKWNGFMPAMLYLPDKELQPLALYVRRVVIQNAYTFGDDATVEQILSAMQLKYTVIVVAVVPLLLLYPIFGKYMKKGLMVGSLKG